MEIMENVSVVIRSVNERTEELCKKIITGQGVPERNVFLIREIPFSKAMKAGYQAGIDNGLKWTYCIDADVLLRNGAVKQMLEIAEDQPAEVFSISAKLLDKLFNRGRRVGNHLFRTSSLPKMINYTSPYQAEGVRPETDAKNRIIEEGGTEHKVDKIIGLHDFEQHYSDIARKAYVHADKHLELSGSLLTHWKENAAADDDFKAALIGFSEGLKHFDKVKINRDNFDGLTALVEKHLKTKPEITATGVAFTEEQVEKIISAYNGSKKKESGQTYYNLTKKMLKKLKRDSLKLFRKQN